jgi:predicted GNAT family acetyltransferase
MDRMHVSTDQQTPTAGTRIEHRDADHRFVLIRDGAELAHLEYVVHGGVWYLTHTYTEPAARGGGLGAQVVQATLNGAREAGVRIRPICPFVGDFLAVHPEYLDVVERP